MRIFNSNVKSILLYGAETWNTTVVLDQQKNSVICQWLSPQNPWHKMAWKDIEWWAVAAHRTTTPSHGSQKEKVGLDWPHPEEAGAKYHPACPVLEPTWQEKMWTTKQHLASLLGCWNERSWLGMSRDRKKRKELVGGLCSARNGQA